MRAIVAAALAAGACASGQDSFSRWMVSNGKKYATANEMKMRRAIFAANVAKIAEHNAGKHTWTMGVNAFADLTADEFKARYASGLLRHAAPWGDAVAMEAPEVLAAPPASVDWQKEGGVTSVKNEGQCGACWAFSSITPVETAAWLSSGKTNLTALSVQQLMDCSGPEGNQGCNGGLMDNSFQYIIDNGGICTAKEYPWVGSAGNCKKCTPAVGITGYVDVPTNSESALEAAVAMGVVAVAIEADQSVFQFYTGGVLTAPCGTQLDHSLAVVGYGTDPSGGAYWRAQNVWGASWGEAGYVRLGRGAAFNPSGECGIQMEASYPTGAHFL